MTWVTAYGRSAECLADVHEECATPERCDCDCHLEDPSADDSFDRSWGY